MAGIKLDEDSVKRAVCPAGKKDVLLFDSRLPGFGVRVTSAGGKHFIAQYTVNGVRRRIGLGRFGPKTVAEARAKARAILGQAEDGIDHKAEEIARNVAAASVAAEAAFTVRKLIEDWADARKADRRENYIRIARAHLLRNLEPWLERPASSITTAEAVRLLDAGKKERGTTTANRTLAYARAAYSWAVNRQMLTSNPLRGVERPGRETERERVLTGSELAAIWQSAGKLGLVLSAVVRVMMMTLQRGQEVAAMRWDELDNPAAPTTWTLPSARAKNARAQVVHLSEPVREILGTLPRIVGNPYVFAGQGRRGANGEMQPAPVKSLNFAKSELGEKLGADFAPWVFHDFRRSGVTALADMGWPPHVPDRLLNHVTGAIKGVARVYQRAEFLPERRAALDSWAEFVLSGGKKGRNSWHSFQDRQREEQRRSEGSNVVQLARAG